MIKVIKGKNQIARLAQIRNRIRQLTELEKGLTKDALIHLETYGTLKEGEWSAGINVTETRRPKWKEEFVKECGLTLADIVVAKTKASVSKKVLIFKDGEKIA